MLALQKQGSQMPPDPELVLAVSPLACTEMTVCIGRAISRKWGALCPTAGWNMVPEVRDMTLALRTWWLGRGVEQSTKAVGIRGREMAQRTAGQLCGLVGAGRSP